MKKLSELKVPYTIAEWTTFDKKDYFVSMNDLRAWAIEHIKELYGDESVKDILQAMFELSEDDLK